MEEIHDQLAAEFEIRTPPDAVVTCVGGGGLAAGAYVRLAKNAIKKENKILSFRQIRATPKLSEFLVW